MTSAKIRPLSRQNRRTNFVVTNFCLVCGVLIQTFKAGKFCRRLNIALIIFHLNSKHRTFWQDNGSRSNSRICAMFRAFRASSTQPLFFETSTTKPVLVRDPIQWPKNSRRVFQKTTASDGKLNSGQAGLNSFPEKWLTSLAQFCLLCQFAQVLPGTNFVGGAFEDLSASDKIPQVATKRPHLWSVSDDRKFV